jgi:hypothetical protein
MSVQRCSEPPLINVVSDEANAASEDEQTIQDANLNMGTRDIVISMT